MIKILIAEDEVRSRTALASRLREILGEQSLIETACDGNEAILKARQVEPQLILMDIEMPHKNGLEAAAVIKQQLPQTHIVFLTAYDRFDYAVGAMRSGGEDYLLKPPADAELRELVQKFFKVSPETSCQGLFNQIHRKATKKVPGSTFMLLTLRQVGHLRPLNSSSQRHAYSGNWSI